MIIKAIVIKKQNTGEYDQWITCYTEDYGKIKAVAKSILKPTSVQALHLDLFNLVEFELIQGRGMPIITGAQLIDSHMGIKNSLTKTATAYFFAETIDRMVFENDKDPRLWELIVALFGELNKKDGDPTMLLRQGQIKMLDTLGYLPETDSCKVCSTNLDNDSFGAFNHLLGGIICKKCFISGQGGILISQNDFELMRGNLTGVSRSRRSILDGIFEYISGGKFISLDWLAMLKY